MRKNKFCIYFLLFFCLITVLFVCMPGKILKSESKADPSVVLSKEEQAYIKEHPSFSIAIDTSWMPYGFSKNKDDCSGIIPNIITMVAERTGMQVTFTGKDSYADAIEACRSGETDLVSGIANDNVIATKNDVKITQKYITIGYSAVTKRNIDDLYAPGASYRVALCKGTYARVAMEKRMPTYDFEEYHSNKECMNAVLNDEADIALIANYSAEYFSSWHEYDDLQVIQINDFTWGLCFGVNKSTDPMLIQILNKGIRSINENDINQAIYAGAVDASSKNRLVDTFYDHPILAAAMMGIVVAFTALGIFFLLLKERKDKERIRDRQYEEDIHKKDLLLNSIPAGIGVFEMCRDGVQLRFMNDSFYRMIGDDRESRNKRTSNNFMNGILKEDWPQVKEAVQKIRDGADQAEYYCRTIKPDNSTMWIRLVALTTSRDKDSITAYCSLTDVDEEMKNRQGLQESADIVNAAMRSANMSVWHYDVLNHRILQREGSVGQHGFGKIVEDVPEGLIRDGFVHPDSAEAYQKAFDSLETATEPIQGDYLIQNLERNGYWWERMILTPVYENGKLTGAIGTSINVTSRKEKERQYMELVDQMTDVDDENLIAKGRYNLTKNTIIYYQRKKEDGLVLPKDVTFDGAAALMMKTAELSEDMEKLAFILNRETLIEDFSHGKAEGSFEYKRLQKEGSYIWTLLKYTVFEEPNSSDIMFFIYSYDISERILEKRILTQLSMVEYEMVGLLDVATGHYTLRSVDKPISDTGYGWEGDYEDTVLDRVRRYVIKEEKERVMKQFHVKNIADELTKRAKYAITYSIIYPDGTMRRKRNQFCYLDDTKTTIIFYRTDETDMYLREQKQLIQTEEALMQAKAASDAKTEFFSRMSHDMRTPMNGILGMAELSEEEEDPAVLKQNIRKIKSSGEYLLSLINDTLDFQRIESGKLQLEPEIVNGKEIFRNIHDMIAPTAAQKGIHLNIKNHNVLFDWDIRVDPVRMKQIFLNLLSNAVKFTPEGGEITVEYECLKREDMISHDRFVIRDSGIGMSEDFLKHKIFKAFSQEHNQVTGLYAGSGLGLSIVKSLVELMGGTIEVESELGVGTTFTLYIDFERVNPQDVVRREAHEEKQKEDMKKRLHGCRILMAEDHPLNAEIARKLLEKAGCEVTWTRDGQECVDTFISSVKEPYDIILMDIRMPVMNGLDAAKRIRALPGSYAKTIPIIAMTANAYEEDIKKSLDSGMNAHLAKPIDPTKLYETVAGYCSQ